MRCDRCIEHYTSLNGQMFCTLFKDWCNDADDMCSYYKEINNATCGKCRLFSPKSDEDGWCEYYLMYIGKDSDNANICRHFEVNHNEMR